MTENGTAVASPDITVILTISPEVAPLAVNRKLPSRSTGFADRSIRIVPPTTMFTLSAELAAKLRIVAWVAAVVRALTVLVAHVGGIYNTVAIPVYGSPAKGEDRDSA